MGKKNTTRQRRKSKRFSKKLTKRNRSKKGGRLVEPGARIDFNEILKNTLKKRASPDGPPIPQSLNKKTANNIIDLGFCTGLHVHILDEDSNDTGNGFYFFYNFKYTYNFSDYKKSKSVVFLDEIKKLLLRKNPKYSKWFVSFSPFVFIDNGNGVKDYKDYEDYDMFDKEYNGIFFAHTKKDPQYFVYSKFMYIESKPPPNESTKSVYKNTNIFKFKNIENVINNFNFEKVRYDERPADLKGLDILTYVDIVPEYNIAKEDLPDGVDAYNGYFVGQRKDKGNSRSYNYSLTRENLENIFPIETSLPIRPVNTDAAKPEPVDANTDAAKPEQVDTITAPMP